MPPRPRTPKISYPVISGRVKGPGGVRGGEVIAKVGEIASKLCRREDAASFPESGDALMFAAGSSWRASVWRGPVFGVSLLTSCFLLRPDALEWFCPSTVYFVIPSLAKNGGADGRAGT